MSFDEDGIQVIDPVFLTDHLVDYFANFQRRLLVAWLEFEGAGIEAEQLVRDTQHSVVLADLDLDAALLQLLYGFVENGASHLLSLLQLGNLFVELRTLLHQLKNQNH
ncbi:hypothetical protein D3C85_1628120 [compost metagenome]